MGHGNGVNDVIRFCVATEHFITLPSAYWLDYQKRNLLASSEQQLQ